MAAKNKILKKAILAEVRQDNLRLTNPAAAKARPVAPPSKQKNRNNSRRYVGLALSVGVGLIFLFFFSALELPLKASKSPVETDFSRQPAQPSIFPPDSPLAQTSGPNTAPFRYPMAVVENPLLDSLPVYSVDVTGYDFLVNKSHVRLTSLFGLGIRTIVIDPGHGGKDPGAIGPQGTMEKEITLDVARRLKRRLETKSAFKIYLTRDTDKTISLHERVNFANDVGADLFISIHVNSIPKDTINTIETYYFGPSSDEETLRLAQRENTDSMYSAAEFKNLIQNIGNTMKQQESIELAVKIQRSLFANVRKYDKDVQNWGVKIAPFVVLLGVEAPAVLTEISCISEPEEEKKLNAADYREKIASFTEKGIVAYLIQKQERAQRGDGHEHKKKG